MKGILADQVSAADGSRFVSKTASYEIMFEGGCRCGGVKYTSTAAPADITFCHCRACQQVSGSGFLPFTHVPNKSLTFTHSSSLKTLSLSTFADRTFCTGCGAPITMTYHSEKSLTWLTMSSIDMNSLKGEKPKVERHIFLKEKASWMTLPDDGGKRFET